MTVYKLSSKGIRNNPFKVDHPEACRIILRGDNSSILYQDNKLIQSDLFYRKPDSYLTPAYDEEIPNELHCDIYELNHIMDHKMNMFCINLIVV